MFQVKHLKAREILDSRGLPTVEVEAQLLSNTMAWKASVPSGASTGSFEACELRDKDSNRFHGKGVLKAISHVNEIIAPHIKTFKNQKDLDEKLKNLDHTDDKSKLGANALLAVSLALAKAQAESEKKELFEFFHSSSSYILPVPLMNLLNGGAHSNNKLEVQEFMIVPVCGGSFKEALRAGSEVFQTLKNLLHKKGFSTSVGDEGGFAPSLKSNREGLEILMKAIEKSHYKPGEDIFLALDVASTEFFTEGFYLWEGKKLRSYELSEVYKKWKKEFPLISIEDGFSEEDWEAWSEFSKAQGDHIQLVGDDLFVTNPKRLEKGFKLKAANALLVKLNQIGLVSEALEAVKKAKNHSYKCVMSHRSGETEDHYIADLAVAWSCEQIKTGGLSRSERMSKYNQLLRIEERLGEKAQFLGLKAFSSS